MTLAEIVIAILVGLAINEACDVSPWLARRLVRWSALHRYENGDRARTRAEELATLIDMRPGKLFKLLTALGFACGAIAVRRARSRPSWRRGVSLKWTLTNWIPWPSTLRSQRLPRYLRQHMLYFAIRVLPEINMELNLRHRREDTSVEEIMERVGVDPPQRLPGRKGELDMLAEALYAVQVESVQSLAEQAYLRRASADVFFEVSRRSQTTLQRMLSEIDEMERGELEPSQRDRLQALSVQVLQLQRGNDKIFAVTGTDVLGPSVDPARLSTILRTVLSENPDGHRVSLDEMVDPEIIPQLTTNTTMLITELLDNAVRYSAPGSVVRLETRSSLSGVSVTIANACAEASSAWVGELNRRLVNCQGPPSTASGLGLAAILAMRSCFLIEFRASADEVILELRIPNHAFV